MPGLQGAAKQEYQDIAYHFNAFDQLRQSLPTARNRCEAAGQSDGVKLFNDAIASVQAQYEAFKAAYDALSDADRSQP